MRPAQIIKSHTVLLMLIRKLANVTRVWKQAMKWL